MTEHRNPPAPVRGDDPAVYVDPFPTLKGTDRVWQNCVCDNGVYTGPSRIVWNNGRGTTKWCFYCDGAGGNYVLVSSKRATARNQAKAEAKRQEQQRVWEAGAADREAAEQAAAAAKLAAEEARRAALVTGFAGEIGDRLKALDAVVDVAITFPVPSFTGYGADVMKAMVVMTLVDTGQVIKTSGTGNTLYGLHRGDKVTVTGTVKGRDKYNHQDQTVLTRTKIELVERVELIGA